MELALQGFVDEKIKIIDLSKSVEHVYVTDAGLGVV